MPVVAEIIHRLWERAGTRPAHTVLCVGGDGSVASRGIGICTPILDRTRMLPFHIGPRRDNLLSFCTQRATKYPLY